MNAASVAPELVRVLLCKHCARQRGAALGAPELAPLVDVASGVCHDCGAGYCQCRVHGSMCPRKNSPLVVDGLTLYTFAARMS